MKLKIFAIFILSSVLITGCSEYERDKFFNEIKDLSLTDEQREAKRIKESRMEIMERNAQSDIQKHFIDKYNKSGKSYKSIQVNWVDIERDFYSDISKLQEKFKTEQSSDSKDALGLIALGMLGVLDYPINYQANYSVTIEEDNFLVGKTIEVEGRIDYFFKKDKGSELAFKSIVMDERVVGEYSYSTGRGEETIKFLGDVINNK